MAARFRILKNQWIGFSAQVAYLIPIFGIILGYIFLKELITPKVLVAVAAVIIGNYLVKKSNNKKILKFRNFFYVEGLISQHPPNIVGSIFFKLFCIFVKLRFI